MSLFPTCMCVGTKPVWLVAVCIELVFPWWGTCTDLAKFGIGCFYCAELPFVGIMLVCVFNCILFSSRNLITIPALKLCYSFLVLCFHMFFHFFFWI